MKIARLILPLLCLALPAWSHELWIEPQSYQVEKGATISASLRNGQNFTGADLAWFDGSIRSFQVHSGGKTRDLTGRAGDIPAVQDLKTQAGLTVLAYQSKPTVLTYETEEKFQTFLTHKDLLPAAAAIHAAPYAPPIREVYTRHSKSLIGVGHAKGADIAFGLETEFVALANPYRDDLTAGLPVRLLYQGTRRPDAQIELFDRAPDGTVSITLHRTDASGEALLPVTPGHTYLADAVVLRPPAPDLAERYRVDWQTLWAALTFAVPSAD